MAKVTLGGTPVTTVGELPNVGDSAPDFKLTASSDMSTKSLSDFEGHRLVLNIFPSVDTGVCAQSVRTFNEKASGLDNTKVLCISKDLPFAMERFCASEGLENVVNLTDYKDGNFGKAYGVTFNDGAFESLLSRAVVVVDANRKVVHAEQVPETGNEPNYEDALNAMS